MDNKLNDWILLSIQNPDFTLGLFEDSGINTNNTSIYDREKYSNSPLIQSMQLFLTDGKFDKIKFNNFYDTAILNYNDLSSLTYAQRAMETALFSYNNLAVSKEKRTKGLGWDIVKIANPDRRNHSIERLGFISNPKFTPQEIAQNELIWNNKTQQWEESPNDSWLFRNWTEPTAMATWDFDADANGNKTNDPNAVVYHKGEYKINPETGTYYYETLNGKSPYGKELLTPFDIITKDGSKANKYDFFDSDGLDKSLTGSIMKTTARIAPMFIPYVGPVYVGTNIALELAKVLPILYKSTFGLAAGDNSFANKIEGIAMSFDNNKVSKAGSEGFFNSEQILNLVGDVTKLLYEQRWIFTKAPKLFKKYGIEEGGSLEKAVKEKADAYYLLGLEPQAAVKYVRLGKTIEDLKAESFAKASLWAAKYQKEFQDLGRVMSRLYMTGTSSYQAFSDAKEEGASDLEAAAMFWGYASGMYWLMGQEIGEHVLPELRMEKVQIRNILKSVSETTKKEVEKVSQAAVATDLAIKANIFKRIFNAAAKYGKEAAKKSRRPITEGFNSTWSNMLAEGVEEVSEEVLYDATRATFDAIAAITGSTTRLSQWDTALQRYGLSFFGGMLGGGIFLVSNDIKIRKRYDPGSEEANQMLIYYIRNGEKAEIKRQLTKLYELGAFGDPNLSTTPQLIQNGKIVFNEGTPDDNQNKAVYDLMNQYIDNIDEVLDTEKMNLPDTAIVSMDGITGLEVLQQIRYNVMINDPVSTGKMLLDYNTLGKRFLDLHDELDTLMSMNDETRRNDPLWQFKVDDVNRRLSDLRIERENFFKPETQAKYIGNMMFSSNAELSRPFANTTYRDFVESNYHKTVELLNDYEKQKSQEEYLNYLSHYAEQYISLGYDVFINLLEKFSETLLQVGEELYRKYFEARRALVNVPLSYKKADDSDGTTTLLLLIPEIFGGVGATNENILDLAEELKEKWNPFDEVSNLMIGKKPNSNILLTPLLVTLLLTPLINNVDLLILDYGFIDSNTGNTIMKIATTLTTLSLDKINSYESKLLSQLIPGDPDEDIIAEAFRNFHLDLNPENASQKLNDFIQVLNSLTSLSDILKLDLKTEILNIVTDFYTPEVLQAYRKIKTFAQNAVLNPISKFLASLKITSSGLNIFDIINKAENIFQTKSVSEFVIDGEISIEDIKNARSILNLMTAVTRAMMYENVGVSNPYGFTNVMNQIRKKFGGLLLGMLDTADATMMLLDLAIIDSKLRFIEKLHAANQEATERELNRLAVKLNYLSYGLLQLDSPIWKHADGSKKKVGNEELLNDVIENAITSATETILQINDLGSPLDLTEAERILLEKERVNIENAIYDRFLQLLATGNISRKELIKLFLEGVLPDLSDHNIVTADNEISINSQGITSQTDHFSTNDTLAYILYILGAKSGDFLINYKQVIQTDLSLIAPIPMLEMAVKMGYAVYTNKEFFNDFTDVVQEKLNNEDWDNSVLHNTVFLPGVPGAGKTEAVARIIYLMLGDVKSFTVGPTKSQADKLTKSINPNNLKNTTFDKEGLFNFMGLDLNSVNSDDFLNQVELVNNSGKYRTQIKSSLTYANLSEYPQVIFIDEATHFTAAELMAISQFCKDKNITLILLGDPDQSGKGNVLNIERGNSRVPIPNNINYVYIPASPKLTLSMRDSNTNQRDNGLQTRALSSEFDGYTSYMIAKNNGLITSVNDLWIDLSGKLAIKGTEDLSGVYGEVVKDSITEAQVVNLITNLELGEKVGFIYEDINSATYLLMSRLLLDARYADKIEFFTEESALGSENLFFIVDVNWGLKQLLNGNESEDFYNYKDFVKSLHTIVTRSKQGSIIIDNELTSIINPSSFKTVPITSVSKISMSDTSLVNYKQKRLTALEAVLLGYTPSTQLATPPTTPNNPNTPSGPTPSNPPSGPTSNPPSAGPTSQGGTTLGGTTFNWPNGPGTKVYNAEEFVGSANFSNWSNDTFNNYFITVVTLPIVGRGRSSILDKVKNLGFITYNKDKAIDINSVLELQNAINNIPNNSNGYILAIPRNGVTGTFSDFMENVLNKNIPNSYIKTVVINQQLLQNSSNFTIQGSTLNVNSYVEYNINGITHYVKITEIGPDYIKYITAETMGNTNVVNEIASSTKVEGLAALDFCSNCKKVKGTKNKFETKVEEIKRANAPTPEPITITPLQQLTQGHATYELTDEELLNVINIGLNSPGIKVYTSFGIKEGISFDRDDAGNLIVDSNGNYSYNGAGDGTLPSDMQVLFGIPNGKSQGSIKPDDYNKAVELLYYIRSIILSCDSSNINSEVARIEELINKFRQSVGAPVIQLNNPEFGLKLYGKYQYNANGINANYYPDVIKHDVPQNKIIVFRAGDVEFTLGTIAAQATNEKYIDQIDNYLTNLVNDQNSTITLADKDTIMLNWQKGNDLLAKIVLHRANHLSIDYIPLPQGFTFGFDRKMTNSKLISVNASGQLVVDRQTTNSSTITANQRVKLTAIQGDKVIYNYETYRVNPRLICSRPHILTGVSDGSTINTSDSLTGKVIIYVTHDLDLAYWPDLNSSPEKLDSKNIAKLWKLAAKYPFNGLNVAYDDYMKRVKASIKRVKLDVTGVTLAELIEDEIRIANEMNSNNTQQRIISSYGNVNTGARLFEIFCNLESEILHYVKDNQDNPPTGLVTIAGLTFTSYDLVKGFELNLRTLLRNITSDILTYLEFSENSSNLTTLLRVGIFSSIHNKVRDTYGLAENKSIESMTADDITKIDTLFDTLFNLIQDGSGESLDLSWFNEGAYQAIGKVHSFRIIRTIMKFFSTKESIEKHLDNHGGFLDLLSTAVLGYKKDSQLPGQTNNFTHGIFMKTFFVLGNQDDSRTAEEQSYEALYNPDMPIFTVNVSIQSPDYILDGNAFTALELAFASTNINLPQPRKRVLLGTKVWRKISDLDISDVIEEVYNDYNNKVPDEFKINVLSLIDYKLNNLEIIKSAALSSKEAFKNYIILESKLRIKLKIKMINHYFNYNVSVSNDGLVIEPKYDFGNYHIGSAKEFISVLFSKHINNPFTDYSVEFIPKVENDTVVEGTITYGNTKYAFRYDGTDNITFTELSPEVGPIPDITMSEMHEDLKKLFTILKTKIPSLFTEQGKLKLASDWSNLPIIIALIEATANDLADGGDTDLDEFLNKFDLKKPTCGSYLKEILTLI